MASSFQQGASEMGRPVLFNAQAADVAHHSLRDHKKLKRLIRLLRIPKPHAVGLLECLWWSVYTHTSVGPAGLLLGWTDEDVADSAGWPVNTANRFLKALLEAGFLERTDAGVLMVHDLYDWVPDYIKKRWKRQGWRRDNAGMWLHDDQTLADNGGHVQTSATDVQTAADNGSLGNDTRPDPTKRNVKKTGPVESLSSVRTAGNPRQTRAGPEVMLENSAGTDRTARAQRDKFRSVFAAKVCIALGLNGLPATQQRRSLYAVARRIEGRADTESLATRFIAIATEKRDAGLDRPIAAWQKAVNEVLGKS